ncbi:glycosyltransferase family 4 protein [Thermosediminibacter oceani]|uniref:Glycosyl transferase group 1 n=1 Tax=Thermosediminibacter oceani (strain ATCC BAA-1034 / DSM 16646 / JW/IW-1228P) TaxID=555079 RepID=D9S1K2_THEOJ|nr:glycosyltransferase family 4 protein [Thermosediminibacter oceani]ADL07279.1 glycosyl transferase group 1 [Thermosediminibacter oceani DSM 16646]
MKVLHIVLKPRFSGAEILVKDLAVTHSSQGIAVGIAAFNPPEDDFMPIIENLSISGVKCFLPVSPLKKTSRLLALWNWLAQFRPDIIVAHSAIPALYTRIALFNRQMPKVISVLHAVDDYRDWRLRLPEYILRWKSARVVAVSDESARYYIRRFPKAHIKIIPNGIHINRFILAAQNRAKHREYFGLAGHTQIVLQVGRITPVKQQHLSLAAIIPIMRENPNVELWFIGPIEDKSYYNALLDKVRSFEIAERVRFWGGQSNLELFLAVSDLLLMPSVREASSIAFLEALASGIPVIASDIPAFAFAEKYPGVWLVSPENTPEFGDRIQLALAEKMRHVRDLSSYSFQRTAEQYLSLFKEVLDNEKGCVD